MKFFAPLFFKKAGGVQRQRLWPRSAERGTPLFFIKIRKGVQGGTLAGGSPFYFSLVRVRRYVGRGSMACPAFRPHFFCLAKRNGVEPPKKSAFLPWRLHHSRERYCLGGRNSSSPDLGAGAGGCRGVGACAPIRWVGGVGLSCLSTPFLWCLPKETVSSRQRKAL